MAIFDRCTCEEEWRRETFFAWSRQCRQQSPCHHWEWEGIMRVISHHWEWKKSSGIKVATENERESWRMKPSIPKDPPHSKWQTIRSSHICTVSPDKNNARTISMQVGKPIETNSTFLDASYHRIYIWKCWDFHISPPPHQLLELVISRILPVRANMENIHLGPVKVLKDSFVLPANHIIGRKHNEKTYKIHICESTMPKSARLYQVKTKQTIWTTWTTKQHPLGPCQGPQESFCAPCNAQSTLSLQHTNFDLKKWKSWALSRSSRTPLCCL